MLSMSATIPSVSCWRDITSCRMCSDEFIAVSIPCTWFRVSCATLLCERKKKEHTLATIIKDKKQCNRRADLKSVAKYSIWLPFSFVWSHFWDVTQGILIGAQEHLRSQEAGPPRTWTCNPSLKLTWLSARGPPLLLPVPGHFVSF